jgi:hypothetical protein
VPNGHFSRRLRFSRPGARFYRQAHPAPGVLDFGAFAVVSDGKIYLASEDGDIFVVSAGAQFELLKTNSMNEPVMATPAISGGTLIVRTQHVLYGIRQK